MRTSEVEKCMKVTKEALRYYEKEGLIVPIRDHNGYRNYSDSDIFILQSILDLRTIDVSIEEIKKVFAGELSLYDCLKQKEQFIHSQINNLKEDLERINHFVARKKVNFIYQDVQLLQPSIIFQDNQLIIRKVIQQEEYQDITIAYKDIQKCIVSMCSRTYAPTASSYLGGGILAVMGTVSLGIGFHFYVDLELYVKNRIFRFESTSLKHMKDILYCLKTQTQSYTDDLDLYHIFEKYPNRIDLELYIEKHFKKWAKQYHLDNPRGNEIHDMIINMKEKLKKVESLPETTYNPLID